MAPTSEIRQKQRLKSLAGVGIAALMLAGQAAAAHPHLDGRLKAFLQSYVMTPKDPTASASVAEVDLRGDGGREWLVYLGGQTWCGSGGCPLLVLAPDGSSFRLISNTTIVHLPIRVLTTRSRGWSDLGVNVAGGGVPRAYVARLPFDGAGYAANPTIAPASPVEGPKGAIVISADDRGEPLFP